MKNLLFLMMVGLLVGCSGGSGGGVVVPPTVPDDGGDDEDPPLSTLLYINHSLSSGFWVFPNISNELTIEVSDSSIVDKVFLRNTDTLVETEITCSATLSTFLYCGDLSSQAIALGSLAGNNYIIKIVRLENAQESLSITPFTIGSDPAWLGPPTGPITFDMTQCAYADGGGVAQSGFLCFPRYDLSNTDLSWKPIVVEDMVDLSYSRVGLFLGFCDSGMLQNISNKVFLNTGTDEYSFSIPSNDPNIGWGADISLVVYNTEDGQTDDYVAEVKMCQNLGRFEYPSDSINDNLYIVNNHSFMNGNRLYAQGGEYRGVLAGSMMFLNPGNVFASYDVLVWENRPGIPTFFQEDGKWDSDEFGGFPFSFPIPLDAINGPMILEISYRVTTATGRHITNTISFSLQPPLRIDSMRQNMDEQIQLSLGNDSIIVEGMGFDTDRNSIVYAISNGTEHEITSYCSLNGNSMDCSGFGNDLGVGPFSIRVQNDAGESATSQELTIFP